MITPGMRRMLPLALALLAGLASTAGVVSAAWFPSSVPQGSLVIGRLDPGESALVGTRELHAGPDGHVVFGVGRDAGEASVEVRDGNGRNVRIRIEVTARDWPVERIVGVPPKTVEPPPDIAERIRREQALVVAARQRDDARDDYLEPFQWPVEGRISGRFGNQRVYVVDGKDKPGSPHSGMDIAAPQGTPVKAPAAGVVTFADDSLYLTGGTLLLDHGRGVSSNFLHLSRIDVKPGDRVEQGQVIGAVGKTGRATGPHLHWGMNWFDVRVDPLLLLPGPDAPHP